MKHENDTKFGCLTLCVNISYADEYSVVHMQNISVGLSESPITHRG